MIKILLTISLMLMHTVSFSHPGKLAKDGCHYCRSQCEKYGLKANTRHDKNGVTCPDSTHGKTEFAGKKYNRKYFKHWIDADKDCQNTRAEVLISRSSTPVTFKKSKKCVVHSGTWDDYYFAETLNLATSIDIDHVVPLKEAWESGAHKWSAKKRKEFANDFENLVITNKRYNRQKGAQTPLTWAPVQREYYCKYLKQWIKIKQKYELKIDDKIFEYVEMAKCD